MRACVLRRVSPHQHPRQHARTGRSNGSTTSHGGGSSSRLRSGRSAICHSACEGFRAWAYVGTRRMTKSVAVSSNTLSTKRSLHAMISRSTSLCCTPVLQVASGRYPTMSDNSPTTLQRPTTKLNLSGKPPFNNAADPHISLVRRENESFPGDASRQHLRPHESISCRDAWPAPPMCPLARGDGSASGVPGRHPVERPDIAEPEAMCPV